MEAGVGAERRVVAVSNAAFEEDPPPYSPPDPKSAELLFPVVFHPQPHPHPPPFIPQPLPCTAVRNQARSPRPRRARTAADPHSVLAVRGASWHRASNRRPAASQGLPGGVGAGDVVLLLADRARRPPLFTRGKDGPAQPLPRAVTPLTFPLLPTPDPCCARPWGRGPGPGGVQEGAVAGAVQPHPGAVRLLQLGHLCAGGSVLVTGPQSAELSAVGEEQRCQHRAQQPCAASAPALGSSVTLLV